MANYTLDELKGKSIFEMRDIAKDVGVPAPTKLNKAELVDIVYKITSGQMEPPIAPRRGRPKKSDVATVSVDVKPEQNCNGNAQDSNSNVWTGSKSETKKATRSNDDLRLKSRLVRPERQSGFFRDDKRSYADNHTQHTAFAESKEGSEQIREGYLEINPDGYGFLRVKNGEFNEMDAYIGAMKIKQYGLRRGDYVKSNCKFLQEGRPAAVVNVLEINGIDAAKLGKRPNFDDLVPIYPDERIRLEVPNSPREYATRCIDLVSPIGKGQRGIIVSPPKAGKTTLLKMIASSIAKNYPDVELKVLLIDERPEEVTDMQRSINGEVIYSTFDELPEHHTKTAELLLDRAKRMVETGKDVVILLDSLTRLARAYNLTIPPTGRTLSGGIDPGALHSPKRFFGSARNIEKGGSLTIIATALVDTGSRMDDVIFEEFKGTGNMEIHLDRKLSEKRIFPAIDLAKSGTRKEELLLTPSELEGVWGIRKMLSNSDNADATENLINMIVKTTSNKEFIDQLNMQFKMMQKEGYTIRSFK